MKVPTISLCMIVKDEERCLARCLDSVKEVVQEIIIIDTGSKDRTVEIAKHYTDKVYSFVWTNDFAEARNYALSYATCDYILHLDADEFLDGEADFLKDELNKDYYFLRIRNDIGSGMAEVHQFVRLFRNAPEFKYEGALHEQINIIKHSDRSHSFLDATIHHDGYLEHIVQDKAKSSRNMNIIKEEVRKNPNAFNYYNLGMQLSNDNHPEEALKALQKAYELGKEFSYAARILLYIMKCLTDLKRHDEAIQIGRDSSMLYPMKADFQFKLGLLYEHYNYFEDAILCFHNCLDIGEDREIIQFNHIEGTGSYLAHGKLAELYLKRGDHTSAQKHVLLGAQEAPDLIFLIKIFVDLHPTLTGVDFVEALIKIWPFTKSGRVEQIIAALYKLRHPGTVDLIKCYNVEPPSTVRAWLHIVEGNYEQAMMLLSDAQEIGTELRRDLLLISLLTRDVTLMREHKVVFNLRDKEWKWLLKVVTGVDNNLSTISNELEEIWSELCQDLMSIQKYDEVERLILINSNPILRYHMASQLFKKGFSELAVEVIVESPNRHDNTKIYALVVQILKNLNHIEDALHYAKLNYELNREFEYAYETLLLLVEQKMYDEADVVLLQMKEMNPSSEWVQTYTLEKVY
ncbi:glycosyltransferase [Paenibacillus sp. UMB4589-SE434]|uniref:tetratricopeptide repeat-containing glycosyltransferase family 2 protein n=1 Tax=Paenibacillus sp. UMB4589-SE434 TaxID=3046314 RepID=UPI002551A521|nr:glycosyltransferase [Paenibacillus sp. UMB4589-SE434]MDK8181641.1 glycosyltransferase [Paenibacillus sp. UMB4589-SE434]